MPSQTARCYQNSFALIQSLILGLFLQDRKKKTQSWVHVKMDYKLRDEKTTSPHLWINLDILLHFVLLTVIYFYGLFCQRDKQSLLIYLVTSEDINIDGVKTCQAGSLPQEFFPVLWKCRRGEIEMLTFSWFFISYLGREEKKWHFLPIALEKAHGMQILMAAVALFSPVHSGQGRWNGCAMHIPEESVPLLQEAEHWELSPSTACSAAAAHSQGSVAK